MQQTCNPVSTLDWTLSGNTAAGHRFTLERHLHTWPTGDDTFTNVDVLRWCCPELKRLPL